MRYNEIVNLYCILYFITTFHSLIPIIIEMLRVNRSISAPLARGTRSVGLYIPLDNKLTTSNYFSSHRQQQSLLVLYVDSSSPPRY